MDFVSIHVLFSPYHYLSYLYFIPLIFYPHLFFLTAITNIHTVVNVGLATAEGLAVDWITRHLYWVESNLDQIEVANFDGTQRTTLIAGNMDSPRAIVVDPRHGYVM